MDKLKESFLTLLGFGFLFVFIDRMRLINLLWEISRGFPEFFRDLSAVFVLVLFVNWVADLAGH